MQNWIPFFVIVAALAIVLQTLILGALFLQMRSWPAVWSRLQTTFIPASIRSSGEFK